MHTRLVEKWVNFFEEWTRQAEKQNASLNKSVTKLRNGCSYDYRKGVSFVMTIRAQVMKSKTLSTFIRYIHDLLYLRLKFFDRIYTNIVKLSILDFHKSISIERKPSYTVILTDTSWIKIWKWKEKGKF